jgi:hypothetical protein
MGIWGSEQQLIRFGREGEWVLGEEGCRRPPNCVDVLSGDNQN